MRGEKEEQGENENVLQKITSTKLVWEVISRLSRRFRLFSYISDACSSNNPDIICHEIAKPRVARALYVTSTKASRRERDIAAILNPSAGGFYSTAAYTGVIPCLSLPIRILFRVALTIFSVGLFRKIIRRVRVFRRCVRKKTSRDASVYYLSIVSLSAFLLFSDQAIVASSSDLPSRDARDVLTSVRDVLILFRGSKFLRLAAKVLRVFKTNACLLIFMTSVLMLGHDVPTRTPCHGDFQRLIPSSRYTA